MERCKDCLAALVPYYGQDGGNATFIFTTGGKIFEDRRTVKWNLRRLARLYSVDLEAARQNQEKYFHYSQGLPLPLSPALVLVPLKTRTAVGKNDGCHSYLNPSAVVSLEAVEQGEVRTIILLSGEYRLPCYYTIKTVQKRLRDGAIALERYRAILKGRGPDYLLDYKDILRQLIRAFMSGVKQDPGG
ncbi:MAG TPA: hypothetical protein PK700_08000 [Bacillota bacterium]|nr:hypothetical protein [Bacillota bacterium]